MTNHNAFMSDAKGNISLAVRVPVSSQSLFSPSGGRCISIPRKKLVQKIEAVPTQTRIDSWIETMRASSPSRTRPGNISSLPELDEEDEYSSWMAQHPSALSKFDEIAKSSTGKQIVMFLDYDGTLSPIVENPDQAYMTDEMRDAVKGLARYFPTAIVTGRCRDKRLPIRPRDLENDSEGSAERRVSTKASTGAKTREVRTRKEYEDSSKQATTPMSEISTSSKNATTTGRPQNPRVDVMSEKREPSIHHSFAMVVVSRTK
ncbi:hypothetical protein IGI04_019398 [Brassica rapa subsp. trilocularis]|uniref:Trehalose 6-phosphate phosphatase n=1 Tax=Brassica rapa subsp. trilocularis TaxID=1813537 RepID=A0ABQ7MFQ9_BRACM|nr:hypothetical protein IGI04_019398 [Brassica rapa subsp. trilocularis]